MFYLRAPAHAQSESVFTPKTMGELAHARTQMVRLCHDVARDSCLNAALTCSDQVDHVCRIGPYHEEISLIQKSTSLSVDGESYLEDSAIVLIIVQQLLEVVLWPLRYGLREER